ncbi:MAG: outer membrane protein assembly factor BamD [Proteobacteria bacterium]|nr:outer membrane protein assembly factor BamD [Pseudomonadota bacterium]
MRFHRSPGVSTAPRRRSGHTGLSRFGLAAVVAVALSACGSVDDDAYYERPVESLYNEAMDQLSAGAYRGAAEAFDEVDRQHPYSVWATKAQIMAAYAQYQANAYDDAVLAAKRFIDLHPGHRDVAYARYLIAISYYEQISDVGRDQKMTELAFERLDEVIRRFPDTAYARDAKLKLDLARDHLAGKEMEVGRFYLRRGEHIAAINRFQVVVEKYQTTTHVPEALHRLTEAYLALGVTDEAQATAAVLGYNYPGNEWYQDSYVLLTGVDLRPQEDKGSWISRAWNSVF